VRGLRRRERKSFPEKEEFAPDGKGEKPQNPPQMERRPPKRGLKTVGKRDRLPLLLLAHGSGKYTSLATRGRNMRPMLTCSAKGTKKEKKNQKRAKRSYEKKGVDPRYRGKVGAVHIPAVKEGGKVEYWGTKARRQRRTSGKGAEKR